MQGLQGASGQASGSVCSVCAFLSCSQDLAVPLYLFPPQVLLAMRPFLAPSPPLTPHLAASTSQGLLRGGVIAYSPLWQVGGTLMPFNFLFLKTYLTHMGAIDGLRSSGDDGRVLWAGGRGFLLAGWRWWVLKEDPQSFQSSHHCHISSPSTHLRCPLSLNASNSLTKTWVLCRTGPSPQRLVSELSQCLARQEQQAATPSRYYAGRFPGCRGIAHRAKNCCRVCLADLWLRSSKTSEFDYDPSLMDKRPGASRIYSHQGQTLGGVPETCRD